MTKISVALCTYNGEKYLQEQLDSIAKQTHPPDELVVCDDVSSDRTMQILHDFKAHAEFAVHIFRNDRNLGSSLNFGVAIEKCQGDIIVLADQDDVWKPEKLETILHCFVNNAHVGLVFSDGLIVDGQLKPQGKTMWQTVNFSTPAQKRLQSEYTFRTLLQRNYITGAMMAFRAQFKPLILPISRYWVHDYWIVLLLAMQTDFIAIPEPLILYRQHAHNQIGIRMQESLLTRTWKAMQIPQDAYQDAYLKVVDLVKRIDEHQIQISDKSREQLANKLEHWYIRANLPVASIPRLKIILSELMKQRYQKYSYNGVLSALRDILAMKRR